MAAIRLNLIPQKEIINISCSARDNILRTWEFELYNDHSSNNRVTVQATTELTSESGRFDAKLLFEKGDTKLYSAALNLWVEGL